VELHEALYTTRAMRRVKPDPIPEDVRARMMDAAVRAPSGGNQQNWRFVLVDDPEIKRTLGPPYRDAMDQLWKTIYAPQVERATNDPDATTSKEFFRVQRSAQWLADHFEDVPLYLFAFCQHDPTGGSIYPAVWSAMLAARAEGVGSCLTVLLAAFHLDETLEALGVPRDEGWILSACVSFGYPTGRWGVAPRRPANEVTYANRWGTDPGFATPSPLWSPDAP
jgi:nitroreductase